MAAIALFAASVALRAPLEGASPRLTTQPYTAIVAVPTGIGAAMGGFAGDALPVVRAFTAVCDRVVTHPNVMNGAQLYWPHPALQYVEGFALDEFAAGRWGLRPATSQRVGLLHVLIEHAAECPRSLPVCGRRLHRHQPVEPNHVALRAVWAQPLSHVEQTAARATVRTCAPY